MKMKKLFYMLPLLALFASCGSGGANGEYSYQTSDCNSGLRTATENVESVQNQYESTKTKTGYVFNDLKVRLDLKGNIKSLEYRQDEYGTDYVVEFDRNGYLKRDYDFKYVNYIFDSKGRVASRKGIDPESEDRYSLQEFEYYEDYVIMKNFFECMYGRDTTIYKYRFNEEGELISYETLGRDLHSIQRRADNKVDYVVSRYGNERSRSLYFYAEDVEGNPLVKIVNGHDSITYICDRYGNWIEERSYTTEAGGDYPVITTRTIEYY